MPTASSAVATSTAPRTAKTAPPAPAAGRPTARTLTTRSAATATATATSSSARPATAAPSTAKPTAATRRTATKTATAASSAAKSAPKTVTCTAAPSAQPQSRARAPSTASAPKPAPKPQETTTQSPHAAQAAALKAQCAAAHHEAAKLYTERNFQHAIPLFEQAVQLAQQAEIAYALLRSDTPTSHLPTFDADTLKRKTTNMRRLDILAVCYRMNGQPRLYYETTKRAFEAVPTAQVEELHKLLKTNGLNEVFSSPEWSRLAAMVRDWLDLACFDPVAVRPEDEGLLSSEESYFLALLEEEFPLCKEWDHRAYVDANPFDLCKAALLEHYMNTSLELNMHRENAPFACLKIYNHCIVDYEDEDSEMVYCPIRQARVRMRYLQTKMLNPPSSDHEVGNLLEDVNKIVELLEDRPGVDAGLSRFVAQYMASAYLLRIAILHHHHGTIPTDAGLDLDESVERTTMLLQQVVDMAVEQGRNPNALGGGGGAGRPQRASLRATARANVVVPAGPPVTPPRKTKLPALGPTTTTHSRQSSADFTKKPPSSSSSSSKIPLDDPARLCAQIENVCEMLSASGHGLSVLKLLRMLRRLHQLDSLAPQLDRDQYYRVCAMLGAQYLSLGQVGRARDMLGEVRKALEEGEKSVVMMSPDTQVRCLVIEVELYCALGDPSTATASYDRALLAAQGIRIQKQRYRWQAGLEQFQMLERQAMVAQACARLRLARGDLEGALVAAGLGVRGWYKLSALIGRLTVDPGTTSTWEKKGGAMPAAASAKVASASASASGGAIPGVEDPFGPAPGSEVEAAAPTPVADTGTNAATAEKEIPRRKPALQHDTPRQFPSEALVGVYWRCGGKLIDALLRCSQLLLTRGSGRDAELYALEAVDTAQALGMPLTLSRALLLRAEIRLLMGHTRAGEGRDDLARAREMLRDLWAPQASDSARIEGEAQLRRKNGVEAQESFVRGQEVLETLGEMYACVETVMQSPGGVGLRRASKVGEDGTVSEGVRLVPAAAAASSSSRGAALMPNAQARLLIRQAQAMLLGGDRAGSASLLEQVLNLPPIADEVQLHSKNVLGQIALQHAMRSLGQHTVLNSLVDGVVSAPMLSPSSKTVPASGCKAIVKALLSAHASFAEVIHSACGAGDAPLLREAASSQALVVGILHTLELGSKAGAQRGEIAFMSDWGGSVTVLREYMEAVGSKLLGMREAEMGLEEGLWLPAVHAPHLLHDGQQGGKANKLQKQKVMGLFAPPPSSSKEGKSKSKNKMDAFWSDVYSQGVQASLAGDNVELPPNWTVVNISFVPARNAILLTRQGGGTRPLSVHLRLDRMIRREEGEKEGEEEDHLTIQIAVARMEELTAAINAGVHGAVGVEGREAKVAWWEGRRRLDRELQELLTDMERFWLGAFKSILAEPTRASDEDQAILRDKLAGVLKHACAPSTKAGVKIKLDRVIVECIARLRPEHATDEDLEDVIHFVMDAFQVGGVPVPVDEVDIDGCVVEVRMALEEFWSRQNKAASEGLRQAEDDHHLFLVLDKDACAFPWESLAILRDRPVSRIPSVRFLLDRIKMAPLFCPEQRADAAENGRYYELASPKTFWLLNPGGDLKRTESRLTPWLAKQQRESGWRGITGRMPIVDELPKALEENDVFTYFGHGGAEEYIRSARIRKLKRCAVTMLWGCSSGLLRDQGELERMGTAYHYMLGGAPALVASMWDMTDLELDRISDTVFCKVGMMADGDRGAKSLVVPAAGQEGGGGGKMRGMSLTRAVAEARRDCRLPYLSGGACITYGVPVYFRASST
ncbi:unnamed protein product [Tilletia laevis]|uniref:separase n=3 Tax=Tilletia TaxID=13289 RepID=A0A9N8LSA5_9BASI|nr:hypothetical protein CF336_g4812 [Tilletia laevis]CAD6890282.1 unnamed protein product [Tilletia caries]KAE8200129.1 hypothetical protein CF335_g4020 [Tilletia laevis]CAD6915708.1 unnamed protein product [Tilletia laevis]CAD6921507.1 unnamed protein product [Tilletia laevis]